MARPSPFSPAQARALDQIADPAGVIVGAAVDHRDSLRTALRRRGLADLPDAALAALKVRIVRALAPEASVVLVDVEYGAAQAIAAGALPGRTALAMPLEAQGYGDLHTVEATTLLEDWGAAQARALGASAAKLLLPFRVDEPEQARRQEAVVEQVVEQCRAVGLALILEPIVYARPGEAGPGGQRFGELVAAGAERLVSLGPEVLKLQYPGTAERCREVDDICGATPWVLLGGGAHPETLLEQVEIACSAGASGFVVGRTLFDAALVPDEADSERALEEQARPLLASLAAIARRHATPWRRRADPPALPPLGWYRPAAATVPAAR